MIMTGRIYIVKAKYFWTIKFTPLEQILREMEAL